jgi:hypothetical protein
MVVVGACALAACGDDEGATPATSSTTPTTASTPSTAVPRADEDAALTTYFPELPGYKYALVGDEIVLPVFGDAIAIADAADVFDRFTARLVTDENDEGLAIAMAVGLQADMTDEQLTTAFEREYSSTEINGEQVFVVTIATQTEVGSAARYIWVDGDAVFFAHGEDSDAVEAYITALIDQRRS